MQNNAIYKIELSTGEFILTENVISSLTLIALSKLLNITEADQIVKVMDKPKHTLITNLMIKNAPDYNQRHYFYCYQSELNTFRITNYNALTQSENEELTYLTVESLFDEVFQEDLINSHIQSELIKMGIIRSVADVSFIKSETLKYGFPSLSLNNMEAIGKIREKIKMLNILNLTRVGSLNEDGIFFMKDTLDDVYKKINNLQTE